MTRDGTELVLLASLNSTADRASAVITNTGYTYGQFVVDVTARSSTDQGPVVAIQGVVPGTSATYYALLTSTAVGTSSTSDAVTEVLHVGPGWSTSSKRAAAVLPARFRVLTTYASTLDVTYSVGVTLS